MILVGNAYICLPPWQGIISCHHFRVIGQGLAGLGQMITRSDLRLGWYWHTMDNHYHKKDSYCVVQITELSNECMQTHLLSISAAWAHWALSLLCESFESIVAMAWWGKTWLQWKVRRLQYSRQAKYSLIPPCKQFFNSPDRSSITFLFEVVDDEVVETNESETAICFDPLHCICEIKYKLCTVCKLQNHQ